MVDNKIKKVLDELKFKKLVDNEVKLRKCSSTLNLQAWPWFGKEIKYNPDFSSSLSKESLRFCILHESEHIKQYPFSGGAFYVIFSFTIFALDALLLIYSTFIEPINPTVLILLLLLPFPFFPLFSPWMRKNEFEADKGAMKRLFKKYKVNQRDIKNVFEEVKKADRVTNQNILIQFFQDHLKCHPSNSERIKNVTQFFDKKKEKIVM